MGDRISLYVNEEVISISVHFAYYKVLKRIIIPQYRTDVITASNN